MFELQSFDINLIQLRHPWLILVDVATCEARPPKPDSATVSVTESGERNPINQVASPSHLIKARYPSLDLVRAPEDKHTRVQNIRGSSSFINQGLITFRIFFVNRGYLRVSAYLFQIAQTYTEISISLSLVYGTETPLANITRIRTYFDRHRVCAFLRWVRASR